jgi:hypothetical protein
MKDGLIKAGLSMESDDFNGLLAGYKEKLWDPETRADHSHEENGNGTLQIETIQGARKQGRF